MRATTSDGTLSRSAGSNMPDSTFLNPEEDIVATRHLASPSLRSSGPAFTSAIWTLS